MRQGSAALRAGVRVPGCADILRSRAAPVPRTLPAHAASRRPGDSHLGDDVDVTAAAVFAIQVALAALWRSWGIQPAAVVGHSMGEVAAAHVAGTLNLDDAARLICARSRLIRRTSDRAARTELSALLEGLQLLPAKIPMYSSVTGDVVDGQLLDGAHWMANLGSPVRISSAMRRLAERGNDTFLESARTPPCRTRRPSPARRACCCRLFGPMNPNARPCWLRSVACTAADSRSPGNCVPMGRSTCHRAHLSLAASAVLAGRRRPDRLDREPHRHRCERAAGRRSAGSRGA